MASEKKRKSGGYLIRLSVIGELMRFMWKRKLWWLIPMVLILIFITALLILVQGSALSPFIYSMF